MKKILAVLLATMLLLSLCATALADTLIMGTNAEFPPFEYVEADDSIAGFDVEIGKLIAEALGKDFFVDNVAFDSLIMMLDNGQIDIAIAGMTITEDRLKQVDFSDPYFVAEQKVIVLEGNDTITSLEDLKDKTVGVQEGTTGHLLATDTLGMDESTQVVTHKAGAGAILDLLGGRVDAVIIDSAPAQVFVSTNEGLVILDGIEVESESYGIAVKKGNTELLDAINQVLADIQADGTYDALLAEFFSEDATEETAE